MSMKWTPQTPTEAVVERINQLGLQNAARYYATHPSTLSRWLKSQNYCIKRIYVKVEKTA